MTWKWWKLSRERKKQNSGSSHVFALAGYSSWTLAGNSNTIQILHHLTGKSCSRSSRFVLSHNPSLHLYLTTIDPVRLSQTPQTALHGHRYRWYRRYPDKMYHFLGFSPSFPLKLNGISTSCDCGSTVQLLVIYLYPDPTFSFLKYICQYAATHKPQIISRVWLYKL